MADLIYREILLPLPELRKRFPGMLEKTEYELLESSSPKVLPALTGQRPAQNQRQADFIDVLMGKAEPMTRAETVWRKFVVLQHLAYESARMQSDIETKTGTFVSLKSKSLALEHSLERAHATIQELEANLADVVAQVDEILLPKSLLNSGIFQRIKAAIVFDRPPEDYTVADIDLLFRTTGPERLERTSLSKL